MKKIYLTITALCLFITTIGHAQPQQFTPQNSIITFDLDDVVLKANKKKMIRRAFRKLGIRKSIRLSREKRKRKGICAEELVLLFRKKCEHKIADFIEDIANRKNLICGTVNIINELKKRGYTIHAASNMGTGHYQKMKTKFPDVFKHFEKAKVVPYEERYKNGTAVLVKPDPGYFKEYLRDHNGNNKKIVFIDDKQENINAARSVNITGIKFDNPKQLRADLQKLGVLPIS